MSVAGSRQRATALLIDLDGVLRVYDRQVDAAVEKRYGLPPGSIHDVAFSWPMLLPAITGLRTHAEWMVDVAEALSEAGEGEAARAAVAEWQRYHGDVVPEVLAFVREVRAAGLPVVIATNATDKLDADLADLALTHEVDAVVNSSVLGTHKPTKEFFAAACDAAGTPPERCLFVDDDDRNVRGARVAGLSGFRYTGPDDFPYLRSALGIAAPDA